MKTFATVLASILVTSAACAAEATFESVQAEFQKKVVTLAAETNATPAELQAKLAAFARETLGAHPDLMRKETERRLAALPVFPEANLTNYREHKSLAIPEIQAGAENQFEMLWLVSVQPERLAGTVKALALIRELGPAEFGRLTTLIACCPDKVYRLGNGKAPDLVVESLGDLFVIKTEMTPAGVCRPLSVKWMKRKDVRAAP